jgi:hypothetical protein
MKYIEVYKSETHFSSFPSIALTKSGEIIVAFRRAGLFSVNAAKNDSPTHHDRDSEICIIFSKDIGESYDLKSMIVATKLKYGVNDPGISVLSSGEIILNSAAINVVKSKNRVSLSHPIAAHRPDLNTISSCVGVFVQSSKDNGLTWTEPNKISVKDNDSNFCTRESVIELEDGTILLSLYEGNPYKSDIAYLVRSWNSGKSWDDLSVIAKDNKGTESLFQGISFNETAILNLGEGKLLSMIRADSTYHNDESDYLAIGGIGELYTSISLNAGFSWSKPVPSGIWGQPAHLLKLNNGDILCTYGYRKKPYSIKAVISNDSGKTWYVDKTITLRENAPIWDMGYPKSVQINNEEIITVYYWVDKNKIRYVESVKWNIKNIL